VKGEYTRGREKEGYFSLCFKLENPKQSKKIHLGFKEPRPQILSSSSSLSLFFSRRQKFSTKTFTRREHALQIRTHRYIMAGPSAMLLSSKGGGGGFSAQFVAGSRRKSSNKKSSSAAKKKSCARAGFFSKDDDFETTTTTEEEEQSSSASSSLAGKAVSAVVAAAISLSSAGQAAVASSSQVQSVRYYLSRDLLREIYISLSYASKKDRIVLDMMMDFIRNL
jgi:hypothetical protein